MTVFKRIDQVLVLSVILLLAACSQATAPGPNPDPTRAASTTISRARGEPPPGSGAEAAKPGVYSPGRYRLKPGELLLAAEGDAIPAIFADDTLFVGTQAGSAEWADEELVIGVSIAGDARAYPVRLLSSHEIVNDRVGGLPIVVTWCPLCFSALVFERDLGRELTFGVSGYLLHDNLVMYDHQTNTLWSQILAQGIRGAMRGERLVLVPSQLLEWGNWKAQHPHTRVLSAEALGKRADEVVDPYAGYYTSGAAGLAAPVEDDRLPAKTLVLGLVVDGAARAYPLSLLQEKLVINDTLGGVPVALVYEQQLETVLVYRRDVEGATLTFREGARSPAIEDEQTGSAWDSSQGKAVGGTWQGQRLERLAAPLVYWFAWSATYPETGLYMD